VQMSRIDVGGNRAGTQTGYTAYGFNGQTRVLIEGINTTEGTSGAGFYFDYASLEEAFLGTTGQSAEMPNPGVQSQFIARSGSNRFQGEYHLDWYNNSMQGSNIPDSYLAPNAFNGTNGSNAIREHSNEITRYYDNDINAGGPIKRDKLWYFGTYRRQFSAVAQPNFQFDKTFDTTLWNPVAKGTYQMNQNNKFIGYYQWGQKQQPNRLPFSTYSYASPEQTYYQNSGSWVYKGEWNGTLSDKLYLEGRYGDFGYYFPLTTNSPDQFFWHDNGALVSQGAHQKQQLDRDRKQYNIAATYFLDTGKGSHTFKSGAELLQEKSWEGYSSRRGGETGPFAGIEHVYANGVSSQVIFGLPTATCQVGSLSAHDCLTSKSALGQIGLFLNDTWAVGRATMNLGVRWDRYHGWNPEQQQIAATVGRASVPAVTFPKTDLYTWNVFAPRIGFTYDLTGDGRTVLKANYGLYWHNPGVTISQNANPNIASKSATYSWNDQATCAGCIPGDKRWQLGEEGAVATDRNAGTVGCGKLRPHYAGHAEPHRTESHRADERIGTPRIAELDEPVVVDADVAHQDGVLRQRAVDLVRGPLRMDRRRIIGKARRDERVPLLAIAVDGAEPVRACRRLAHVPARVDFRQQLAQECAHVRHQPERHRIVAGNLIRIDVDVDEPGRRDREGIARQPGTRRAVVEAHAEREQHVGRASGVIGLIRTVAGDETERQRMLGIDGAGAARRPGDRNAQPFREPQQVGRGATIFDALADQDDRPLRRKQHIERRLDAFGVGAAARRDVGVPLLRLWSLFRRRLLEDVERNVEHNRAGPPGHHGLPRLPDRQRHHVAARGLEHALAVGAHGGGKVGLVVPVELLKRTAVELARRHVAGHRQERDGIEIGVGERDRQIGRARTTGGERRRGPPADAVVHIRHEAGDGLVVNRDGLDLVGALVKRVDEADITVTAQAEDVRHLFADEIVDDHLTAIEHVLGHRVPSRLFRLDIRVLDDLGIDGQFGFQVVGPFPRLGGKRLHALRGQRRNDIRRCHGLRDLVAQALRNGRRGAGWRGELGVRGRGWRAPSR